MINDIKKRALHRCRILQGQMRAIEEKIQQEGECIEMITLSLSVQKSISSLNTLLVENHMREHIPNMFRSGSNLQAEKAISELLKIYILAGK